MKEFWECQKNSKPFWISEKKFIVPDLLFKEWIDHFCWQEFNDVGQMNFLY